MPQDKIKEVLTRAVTNVIVKKDLEKLLRSGKKIKLYLGFDPTSSRIHIGNTVPLLKLKEFQDLGHEVYFLVGSFTALIGDTSDKATGRKAMTQEEIEENFKTYKAQASKILDFKKTKIVYNGDWLSKLGFKEILELANKFTVQQMIERDLYQKRLQEGNPIGLHEFLYPLMQGYDSVALDVDLEIGGNDQLFNMLAGRTLQKHFNNKEKYVLTTELIEGLDGRKMSKSYGNTVDISDEPKEIYGKIMSMSDELIIKYFTVCTRVPMEEVGKWEKEISSGGNPRDAKMALAKEIVRMYHGQEAAAEAEMGFVNQFQKGKLPDEIEVFKVKAGEWKLVDLICETKLEESKSQIRRLIQQGGVKINEAKVADLDATLKIGKEETLIQVGKRRFGKVVG
ncbi:MAG: tyrosine--tRNA ligase [Candidatus Gracilibacteria bacterium]|nr:tyrosine--tRNA ligase [Candidatus Gracilibacteria bacterium]